MGQTAQPAAQHPASLYLTGLNLKTVQYMGDVSLRIGHEADTEMLHGGKVAPGGEWWGPLGTTWAYLITCRLAHQGQSQREDEIQRVMLADEASLDDLQQGVCCCDLWISFALCLQTYPRWLQDYLLPSWTTN